MIDDRGSSLVEVLVAMVLLGISMLSIQAVITDRLVTTVATERGTSEANQLVNDRLARIEMDPAYTSLVQTYNGVESPVAGAPGYVRSTHLVRTNSTANGDYTAVTVRVWSTLVGDTVARSTVVAAP